MGTAVYQPSPRVLASRRNGSKGGLARAAKLTAEQKSEAASKAGKACADAYTTDFYSHINKLRKHVGRNRKAVK